MLIIAIPVYLDPAARTSIGFAAVVLGLAVTELRNACTSADLGGQQQTLPRGGAAAACRCVRRGLGLRVRYLTAFVRHLDIRARAVRCRVCVVHSSGPRLTSVVALVSSGPCACARAASVYVHYGSSPRVIELGGFTAPVEGRGTALGAGVRPAVKLHEQSAGQLGAKAWQECQPQSWAGSDYRHAGLRRRSGR